MDELIIQDIVEEAVADYLGDSSVKLLEARFVLNDGTHLVIMGEER